jgi:PAS domain S-box-containing protein
VRAAALYGSDGKLFATYVRNDLKQKMIFPRVPQQGLLWTQQMVSFADPVELEGKTAGVVYLEADLQDLREEGRYLLWAHAATVCVCLLLVYFLARGLQRTISSPIEALSETARMVSEERRYSVRVPLFGNDELGRLSRDFNHMLDEIEKRDTALREARGSLEARVAERTRELDAEIAFRRRTEQTLRERTAFLDTLIESSPIAIVVADPQGRTELTNPAFRKLFGFEPRECLRNELDKLIAPDGQHSETKQVSSEVLSGRSIHQTARRRRKDGTLIDVEIFGVPLMVDGVLRGLLGLYNDITDSVNAQRALEQAKEAAESASRAKSEFLANMSHEIRTPMNGILGMTELALDTQLTAEQREYLQMAKSSAESLLNIINDILDFSKVEAGRLELENVTFSLAECIEDALTPLVIQAQQKEIELAWEVEPSVPELVKGDATRLRQVLVNLAGNGVKFTKQGHVAIHVTVLEQSESNAELQFTISDTGIGIPEDKHETIFEAFSQADMSTTRTYGGTGLGLSISARLVALMGGRIWLESEVGRGSKFHFTVRLQKPESGVQSSPPAHLPGHLAGKCALVVDDNQVNRRLLELLLKRWEMTPTLAANGIEGLKRFRESQERGQTFPVVLVDMQMPGMDGVRFARELRKISSPEPPLILLLSSTLPSEAGACCDQLGIIRTIVKPIRRAALREALEGVLGEVACELSAETTVTDQDNMPELRVLLAEDNAVNQCLAFRLLEKMGHQVWLAHNGREAVDLVSVEQFDLLLMDIQMPVMGGIEAAQRIRTAEQGTGRHLPIVAMTAHALKGDREACLEAGMDGYVAKPIRAAELAEEIRRVISGKEKTMPKCDLPAPDAAAGELPVDSAELLARVEGDRDLLQSLISIFREDCPKQLDALREAVASQDPRAIASISHALKGMLANLAGKKASAVAAYVEHSARSGELGKVREGLPELEREISRVEAALEEMCPEVRS